MKYLFDDQFHNRFKIKAFVMIVKKESSQFCELNFFVLTEVELYNKDILKFKAFQSFLAKSQKTPEILSLQFLSFQSLIHF